MFCSRCGSQNVQKITIKGQSYFQCDDCGHVGPVFARRSAGASNAARSAPAAKKKGSGLLGLLGLIAIVLALYHFLYGSGPDSKSTNVQTPAVAVETEQAPAVEQPDPVSARPVVGPLVFDVSSVTEAGIVDTGDLEVRYGTLRNVSSDGKGAFYITVLVGRDNPGYYLIEQGYANTVELIRNNGFDACRFLRYGAVFETLDGKEAEFLSFTVPEALLTSIASGDDDDLSMRSKVEDYWIMPGFVNAIRTGVPVDPDFGDEFEDPEPEPTVSESAPSGPAPAETAAVSISAFASNGGSSDGGELVRSESPAPQQAAYDYVLNTNTMKFHYPSCNDVSKIKPENYQSAHDSRENVIAQGYVPCGHCHP